MSQIVSTSISVNFLSKITLFSLKVALLDYGQVKDLPDKLRLGYASLVLAIADSDPIKASESYRFYNLSNIFFFV